MIDPDKVREALLEPIFTDNYKIIVEAARAWLSAQENASAFSRDVNTSLQDGGNRTRIENWFTFDGDEQGLAEYLQSIEWEWFSKGGRDKKNAFVMFLKKGEISVGAIKIFSNKNYQRILTILRDDSAIITAHEGEKHDG